MDGTLHISAQLNTQSAFYLQVSFTHSYRAFIYAWVLSDIHTQMHQGNVSFSILPNNTWDWRSQDSIHRPSNW